MPRDQIFKHGARQVEELAACPIGKSVNRHRRSMLLFVGCVCLWLSGCGPDVPDEAREVLFGVAHRHASVVLSGSGRLVRSFGSEEAGSDYGFFAPDVSPSQRSVALIKCGLEWELGPGTPTKKVDPTRGCELVVADLDEQGDRAVFRGDVLDSPVWHPSGDSIALLDGSRITILSYPSGAVTMQVPIPNPAGTLRDSRLEARPTWVQSGSYIRWSASGTHLYLRAEGFRAEPSPEWEQFWELLDESASTDALEKSLEKTIGTNRSKWIGELDLASGSWQWLDLEVPGLHGNGAPYKGRVEVPDLPAYRALYCSASHPVELPAYSPDRRFCAYSTSREGLFATAYWVEGYDIQTSTVFEIHTF